MGKTQSAILALLGALAGAPGTAAQSATGPGIPRVTFSEAEVGKRVFQWDSLVGRVPKAMMFQGHLVIFQNRSRRLSAFDLADPRSPKPVSAVDAQGNGDEHVVPSVGTRLLASGSLVDYADPKAPRFLGRFAPYFLSVWPAFQWPYLYNTRTYDADGKSSPLAIIDYSNPAAPRQVKAVDAITAVGFTTGTTHVIGNLLLVTSGDIYAGVSAWDIGDPLNPVLLGVNKTGPGMYTSQQYGKYIVTTGPKNLGRTAFFDYSDPEDIRLEWQQEIPDMGDYAHFQNGHLFGSRLDGGKFVKYDIAARKTVLTGLVPALPDGRRRPTRYCIPLGNMLFLGDPDNEADGVGDGKVGASVAALFAHQARPDSVGPALLFADPPDGAVRQPLTSRIGLAFDEEIDNRVLHAGVIQVRPLGGQPIAGDYGHTLGVIHFTPRQRLLPETTYEVVIPQGGVKDWTGNGNAQGRILRFSTGATVTAGAGRPGARAGWRARARLEASPRMDGGWTLRLAGWDGLPSGDALRVEILDASGRSAGELTVRAGDLRRGVAWRPERGLAGPLLLRARHGGGEVTGRVFLPRRTSREP